MSDNWIDVNEALPEINQRVIVYAANDFTHISCGGKRIRVFAMNFVTDKNGGNNKKLYAWEDGPMKMFGQNVTHWMPIPIAPMVLGE